MLLRYITIVLTASLVLLTGQASRAEPGPLFFSEIETLARSDPATAVARIDAQIAEMAGQPDRDIRTLYSLIELKLFVMRQMPDAQRQQAEALFELARLADANRPTLNVDPLPLLHQAAELSESAGDLRQAARIWQAVLSLMADERAPKDERLAVLEKLAAIAAKRGDKAAQERHETARDRLRRGGIDDPDATRSQDVGYRTLKVFYATDRARTGDDRPENFYGGGRAELSYGTVEVTIPDSHKSGVLEAPSIWRLEFSQSSEKHVVLKSVTPVEKDEFFTGVKAQLKQNSSDEAFVFVHGFNVSFEQATKRAAQLAHDMSFQGVPIAYSWPSRASVLRYVADTAVVRLSGRRLAGFLEDVVKRSGATRVHLIAHSMGNRAMTDALELIGAKRSATGQNEPLFDQIIFAAPDVDAGLFAEMARAIRPLGQRLTLYASRNDWALKVSRKLHGDAMRAGQGGDETLVTPDIDSVDMSELGEDMLAHGYFADDSSALVDLASLFWRNADPGRRCGLQQVAARSGHGHFWRYKPGACNDQVMLPLIANIRTKPAEALKDLRNLLADLVPKNVAVGDIEQTVGRLLTN